jgi:GxxExxY protein
MNAQRSQRNYYLNENELSGIVIRTAIDIHRNLGPGLLESAYKECMMYQLSEIGLNVFKEKPMPLIYKDVKMDCGYRLDLLVENKLVVEVKSVEALNDIHLAQTLTYMKLGNYKLGLLMNFNVLLLKQGIKRIINGTL